MSACDAPLSASVLFRRAPFRPELGGGARGHGGRARSTRSLQNLFSVTRPREFQDERAGEMQIVEMRQVRRRIDCAVSRRKVIVEMAVVVAGVHHPEMPGKLVNYRRQVFPEVRVPGVQANANLERVQSA